MRLMIFVYFFCHLKNRSCRSPPVAGWNLYALVRYSCHVKGRYTCGLSSVMSSSGASTVALKGGFKKQARDRRFENPFTAALCKTLLYLVLLRTCKIKTATIGVSKPEIPKSQILNLQQGNSGQEGADDDETSQQFRKLNNATIGLFHARKTCHRQVGKSSLLIYPQHNYQTRLLCFGYTMDDFVTK